MKLLIHTDGGARGNPGPAGIGVVIRQIDEKTNRKVETQDISGFIGDATNNQAEYSAVVKALEWVRDNIKETDLEIEFLIDSELVVEQLSGRYKIKNEGLKPLFWQVRDLVMALGGKVAFSHIPRSQNQEADKLVNLAIDQAMEQR